MPNPENLKPFPPGVSGNPGGKRKGPSLTARLRELLEQREIGGKPIGSGKQVADLVVEALVKGALKGDARHLQAIWDRLDGRVAEAILRDDDRDRRPRLIIPGSDDRPAAPDEG